MTAMQFLHSCLVLLVLGTSIVASPLSLSPTDSYAKDYQHYIDFNAALKAEDTKKAQRIFDDMMYWNVNFFIRSLSRVDLAIYYVHRDVKEAERRALNLLSYESVIKKRVLELLIETSLKQKDAVKTLTWYGEYISQYRDADIDFKLLDKIKRSFNTNIDIFDALNTLEKRLSYLQNLIYNQSYKRAYTLIQRLEEETLSRDQQATLEFLYGLLHINQFQYAFAIPKFRHSIDLSRYSQSEQSKALYYLGVAYEETGDIKKAKSVFDRASKPKKKSSRDGHVHVRLLKLYSQAGDFKDYNKKKYFLERVYSNSYYYKEYLWEEAWKEQVSVSFSGPSFLSDAFTQPKARAAILGMYKTQEDMAMHPVSYFSKTLIESLDQSSQSTLLESRLLWMTEHGIADRFEDELKHKLSQIGHVSSDEVDALLEIYTQKKQITRGIDTASNYVLRFQKKDQPISQKMAKSLYPRYYWKDISRYAARYRVDPYLLLAIMREESQFAAKSSGGFERYGLLRLPARHGRALAMQEGERWDSTKTLFDSRRNIKLGASYLSAMLKRHEGNIYLTLAEFHHSREAAISMKEKGSVDSYDKAIAFADYPELRDYMRRVNDAYVMYRLLY